MVSESEAHFNGIRESMTILRVTLCCLMLGMTALGQPSRAQVVNTWTELPESTPEPDVTKNVPMVYASQINRMILTGGLTVNDAPLYDTWSYDLDTNEWTLLIQGPTGAITPGRREFGMAYDPGRNLVIVFGGSDENFARFDETWILDLNATTPAWTLVNPPTGSPPATAAFQMTYDESADRVVTLVGGTFFPDETWLFDPGTYTWTQVFPATSPSPRDHFNIAYDPAHQVSILFGGHGPDRPNGEYYADTWTYNARTNEWTEIFPSGSIPIGRDRGQLTYIGNGTMVLFGGKLNSTGEALGDTWTFNLDQNQWVERTPSPSPPDQYWPAVAYHSAGRRAVRWGVGRATGEHVWTYEFSEGAVCNDRDGDGYGLPGDASCPGGADEDCDDTQVSIYPGAPELCDGVDNNCNLATDEAQCEDFDVNSDSLLDGVELAWVGRAFGSCSTNPVSEWWFAVDYTTDGCVDGEDLAILSSVWGCDAPGPVCE